MTKAESLRALIARNRPIVTPTAHDALSARLIAMLGFESIAIGGSTMLAARYGLPDLGMAGFAEMVESMRDIVTSVDIPCIVDADDGYGDVKSVVRTVHGYEDIGVAALVLEDQDRATKRPGNSPALRVSDVPAMVTKLRAAVSHRRNPATVVVARTDSYALEGVDGALRRCEAYLRAGADGIFVPAVTNHEHVAAIGRAFPGVYKVHDQVEGKAPWLSASELHALGYTQIAYPRYIMNRMVVAMESACSELQCAAALNQAPAVLPELDRARERFNAAVQLGDWHKIESGLA